MSIWLWNPKTCRISVPEAQVTIHGIQTLAEAHEVMDNNFDPSKYQFVAQTKTGKPYNFSNFDEAEAFAIQKSNKRSGCTVYSNGKPLVSYFDKKKMPQWQTVFCKKDKYSWHVKKNDFYYSTPKGKYAESPWAHVNTKIETLPGKVRLVDTHLQYVKLKNGHLNTKWKKHSVTFHANGNIYLYRDGGIVRCSARSVWRYWDDETTKALVQELLKLRPELTGLLDHCPDYMIPGVFSRPTYYTCFDLYRDERWKRESDAIYFAHFPREIVDESQIINVLAKRMRIPVTKSLRKLYNEHIDNMAVVYFLRHIGFKDTNSYQKLVGLGVHFCKDNPDEFKPFIKKLIELRGENHVVKMLSDTSFNLIRDVVRSYNTIDEDIAEIVMKDARNIEEVHETFNRQASSFSRTYNEQKIRYNDKEKAKFNYICKDGIKFELAESNKELAIIGQKMGICVGGYGPDALAKRTTIIKMMEGDKYIACIEAKRNNICQIKSRFNNAVERRYKKHIDEWLKHGDIRCDCSDYHRIGSPQTAHYNYAHVNPDNFVHVHHEPVLQIVKCKHIKCVHNNRWFKKDDFILDRIEMNCEYIDNPCMNVVIERERLAQEVFEVPANPAAGFTAIETDELPF